MGDEVGSGTTSGGATVVCGGTIIATQVPTLGRVAALQNSTASWPWQVRPALQSALEVHAEQSIAPKPEIRSSIGGEQTLVVAQKP